MMSLEIYDDIIEIFGGDDSENYGKSKSIASLEIPPSLDNPNYSDSLKVPKTINEKGDIIDMSDAPVLPSYLDKEYKKARHSKVVRSSGKPSFTLAILNSILDFSRLESGK